MKKLQQTLQNQDQQLYIQAEQLQAKEVEIQRQRQKVTELSTECEQKRVDLKTQEVKNQQKDLEIEQLKEKNTRFEEALQTAQDHEVSLKMQLSESQKVAQSLVQFRQQPSSSSLSPQSGNYTPVFHKVTDKQVNLTYPDQVEKMSNEAKNKIDPKELSMLFKWVTEGHLLEVEKLLKNNPTLGLGTLTVTDLSDRTFKNITVLQYVAWCLDEEMCDLIISYLRVYNSAIQLKALYDEPGRYSTYGTHYDIEPLSQKTQTYIDNYSKWSYEECERYWQKEVGGEQRKCPAWLIYAWCEEGDKVAWVKQNFKMTVKREYEKNHIAWWFTEEYNNGKGVGTTWASVRGSGINRWMMSSEASPGYVNHSKDRKCQGMLESVGTERLAKLQAKIAMRLNEYNVTFENTKVNQAKQSPLTEPKITTQLPITSPLKQPDQPTPIIFQAQAPQSIIQQPSSSQITTYSTLLQAPPAPTLSYSEQVKKMSNEIKNKIDLNELSALFKWVTEGYLLEVEKLLQKNSSLALETSTVTDLSDRTFNNITALQYAAWCLDEEMCDLIMHYLEAHHSAIQLKALYDEPGRYSTYGTHYDIKPLIQKTQTYIDNYSKWNVEECKRYWQKEVGREQRTCPAWLIYAWCEEGDKVAWVKQDFKIPVKREYDKNYTSWWFTQEYNNEKGVGSSWGAARGYRKRVIGVAFGVHNTAEDERSQRAVETKVKNWLTKLQAKIAAGLNEYSVTVGNTELSQGKQSPLAEPKTTAQLPITSPPKQPAQPIPIIAQAQAQQSTVQQPPSSQITKYSAVFQPEPLDTTLSYPERVEKMSNEAKHKIEPNELSVLFKWVTEGHLLEVEKLLKNNPTLGLGTLTVTDLSDRTFNNITALQYAAWCLDEEMSNLIMGYLGPHYSVIQLKAFYDEPGRYSSYGTHYDIKFLIQKTQTYIDNCKKWSDEKCCRYWQKEVGGEQRKCPAWLIYAWCERGDNAAWVRQDFKMPVKREYDKKYISWWFTQDYNGGKGVGSKWACARGAVGVSEYQISNFRVAKCDIDCQRKIETNCTERLAKLQAKITVGLNEPNVSQTTKTPSPTT